MIWSVAIMSSVSLACRHPVKDMCDWLSTKKFSICNHVDVKLDYYEYLQPRFMYLMPPSFTLILLLNMICDASWVHVSMGTKIRNCFYKLPLEDDSALHTTSEISISLDCIIDRSHIVEFHELINISRTCSVCSSFPVLDAWRLKDARCKWWTLNS